MRGALLHLNGALTVGNIIERLAEWVESDYRQCSPAQLRTMREELRAAQFEAVEATEAILVAAAGRTLTGPQEHDLAQANARMKASGPLLAQVEDELASRAIDYGQALSDDGGGLGSPFERIVGSRQAYRKHAPLRRGQTMSGYAAARGLVSQGTEDLSLGAALRGIATGDWHGADAERRTMSGLSNGAGAYLLPTVLSSSVIDKARTTSVVLKAGATVVPMENRVVDIPKWLTDPAPGWRAEAATIAIDDATIGKVTLTAKSLAVVVKVSRELIEDTDIDELLETSLVKKFGETVDRVCLYGTGASNQPTGVKLQSGITTTLLGANGLALTSYDTLIDGVSTLALLDEVATAQILPPRTATVLAKFKDTANQPLQPPPYLANIPRYSTTQLPTNLTVGSSNVSSDIFTADWSKLLLGIRTDLQITPLRERYADDGLVGFIGWLRADVALARPAAFCVTTGVL